MKILISFATNSGATMTAANFVADTLKNLSHEVTVKEALETTPEDITSSDCTILATCTWDYNGLEGQPHEHMIDLFKKLESVNLEGKKFALLGLGDSSYTVYCGSVAVMEEFAKKAKINLVIESQKIDGFFYRQQQNTELVQKWATDLSGKLA